MPVRAGRKRKLAARHPGGKLKSAPIVRPDLPHRRGYGSDPRATTLHGRYFLDGAIDGRQYVVGELYLVTLIKYRAAILAPGGLRSRSDGGVGRRLDEAEDAELVDRFVACLKVLGRLARHVESVLCEDQPPPEMRLYVAGLTVLRGVYGL
jgi:hypothetical protein